MAFIHMTRPNLDNVAKVVLPEGYSIRPYRDGEEDKWVSVINMTFADGWTIDQFRREMIKPIGYKGDNIFFLEFGGEPVGTMCAWVLIDNELGWLHMGGVRAGHNGKGLGYSLGLTCLHYFKDHGFKKINMCTYPDRLSAIKNNLNLGFVPMYQENDQDVWSKVFTDLKKGYYT
jgi:GNAT superfamily N-acetyltransferase